MHFFNLEDVSENKTAECQSRKLGRRMPKAIFAVFTY